MTDERAAFKLDGVSKRFGDFSALSDLSFSVSRGERVGIIGPSGAGKTTLLRILGGILQPSSGQLLVGQKMTGRLTRRQLRGLRRRTGFIHQSLDLVPELRVATNVLLGRVGYWNLPTTLRNLIRPRAADLADVHRALEQVALDERMFDLTARLSGGQMQRVALARVLYQDPDAILADEPVASVDPARAEDLLRRLADIVQETGKPCVISLHNVKHARKFCTRLIGLRAGTMIFDAPVDSVSDDDLNLLYDLNVAQDVHEAH